MHLRQRLCLLGGVLLLALLCAWLCSLARLPTNARRLAVPTEPTPSTPTIETAFEKIQIGMSEEELFALMAPYEELYSGHHQWPMWGEGHTTVYVTIWPDRFPYGQWCVRKVSMSKDVFDKGERRWVRKWFEDDPVVLRAPKKGAGLPVVADDEPMDPEDEPKEPAPLEGTWELVYMMTGGARLQTEWTRVTFIDGTWQHEDYDFKATYKIDPTKNPKTIDLTVTSEGRLKGQTLEGIYRIDGNRLQICVVVTPGARQRPTESKAGVESRCMRFVLKRVKE